MISAIRGPRTGSIGCYCIPLCIRIFQPSPVQSDPCRCPVCALSPLSDNTLAFLPATSRANTLTRAAGSVRSAISASTGTRTPMAGRRSWDRRAAAADKTSSSRPSSCRYVTSRRRSGVRGKYEDWLGPVAGGKCTIGHLSPFVCYPLSSLKVHLFICLFLVELPIKSCSANKVMKLKRSVSLNLSILFCGRKLN